MPASAYTGPPPLTPWRALTEWQLDPWALAFILLLGGLYLAGVRRVRARAGVRAALESRPAMGPGPAMPGRPAGSLPSAAWGSGSA